MVKKLIFQNSVKYLKKTLTISKDVINKLLYEDQNSPVSKKSFFWDNLMIKEAFGSWSSKILRLVWQSKAFASVHQYTLGNSVVISTHWKTVRPSVHIETNNEAISTEWETVRSSVHTGEHNEVIPKGWSEVLQNQLASACDRQHFKPVEPAETIDDPGLLISWGKRNQMLPEPHHS